MGWSFPRGGGRDEEPAAIIQEMLEGVTQSSRKKVLTIENRREAIQTAARFAQTDDVILVAGKGHETYQEIKGQRQHFDDKEELINAFIVIDY